MGMESITRLLMKHLIQPYPVQITALLTGFFQVRYRSFLRRLKRQARVYLRRLRRIQRRYHIFIRFGIQYCIQDGKIQHAVLTESLDPLNHILVKLSC